MNLFHAMKALLSKKRTNCLIKNQVKVMNTKIIFDQSNFSIQVLYDSIQKIELLVNITIQLR